MSETELPYFHPQRQARKNVNTLVRSERYNFNEEDRDKVKAERIGSEGFLYRTDESSAALNGDVKSVDEGAVDNAAAFLDGEFEDEEVMWAYGLDSEEENYGIIAAYRDSDADTLIGGEDKIRPASAIVHVFEALDESDQVDIYVERHEEHRNMTAH